MKECLGIDGGCDSSGGALIGAANCRHVGVMCGRSSFPFLFYSESTSRKAKREERGALGHQRHSQALPQANSAKRLRV